MAEVIYTTTTEKSEILVYNADEFFKDAGVDFTATDIYDVAKGLGVSKRGPWICGGCLRDLMVFRSWIDIDVFYKNKDRFVAALDTRTVQNVAKIWSASRARANDNTKPRIKTSELIAEINDYVLRMKAYAHDYKYASFGHDEIRINNPVYRYPTESVDKALRLMGIDYDEAHYYLDKNLHWRNNLHIQLIGFHFVGGIEELLGDKFTLTMSQWGYDGENLYVSRRGLWDTFNRSVKLVAPLITNKNDTMRYVNKLINTSRVLPSRGSSSKGHAYYTIDREEWNKISVLSSYEFDTMEAYDRQPFPIA